MGLSRELLKWLQSLNITTQVRNPRRDLSNGFAVAEIFSCYYPQDVEMFSYENASGAARKTANWELLYKFFKKKEVPITRDMIDSTLHSTTPEASITLLETAYSFLTNKTPTRKTNPPPPPTTNENPTFTRPTASRLIKESTEIADTAPISSTVSVTVSSNVTAPSTTTTTTTTTANQQIIGNPIEHKARELIEEHDKIQRADREKKQQQEGGSIGSLLPNDVETAQQRLKKQTTKSQNQQPSQKQSNAAAAMKRAVTAPTDAGHVQFREVQVKSCEVDPLVLRARAKGTTPRSSRPSTGATTTPKHQSQSQLQDQGERGSAVNEKQTNDLISIIDDRVSEGSISKVLSSSIEGTLLAGEFGPVRSLFEHPNASETALVTFVDVLSWLPECFIVSSLVDIRNTLPFLADSILIPSSPALSQLIAFSSACCCSLHHHSAPILNEVCTLISDVCTSIEEKNHDASISLLLEKGLPECISLLSYNPRERAPIAARVIKSLCGNTPNIMSVVISHLQESLPASTILLCIYEIIHSGVLKAEIADAIWHEISSILFRTEASQNPIDSVTTTLCLSSMALLANYCSSEMINKANSRIDNIQKLIQSIVESAEHCGWWEAIPFAVELCANLISKPTTDIIKKEEQAKEQQQQQQQQQPIQITSIIDCLLRLSSSTTSAITSTLALIQSSFALSRNLSTPTICKELVRVLVALPLPCLNSLLGYSAATISDICSDSLKYMVFSNKNAITIGQLPQFWGNHSTEIAIQTAQIALSESKTISPPPPIASVLSIIHACAILSSENNNNSNSNSNSKPIRISTSNSTAWTEEIFTPMKELLCVEICHENTCEIACDLLEMFFACGARQALESMPLLFAAVTLLAGDSPAADSSSMKNCRGRVSQLLKTVAQMSQSHKTAITNLVLHLSPNLPHSPELVP